MSQPSQIFFTCTPDEKGRLNPDDAHVVRARLAKWAGKHCNVTITRYVKRKTLPQLGYYFGAILPIMAEEVGDTEKGLDADLREAFLPTYPHVNKITGVDEMRPKPLKELTSEEMGEYITRVITEAAKHGCYIPSPEEYYKSVPL